MSDPIFCTDLDAASTKRKLEDSPFASLPKEKRTKIVELSVGLSARLSAVYKERMEMRENILTEMEIAKASLRKCVEMAKSVEKDGKDIAREYSEQLALQFPAPENYRGVEQRLAEYERIYCASHGLIERDMTPNQKERVAQLWSTHANDIKLKNTCQEQRRAFEKAMKEFQEGVLKETRSVKGCNLRRTREQLRGLIDCERLEFLCACQDQFSLTGGFDNSDNSCTCLFCDSESGALSDSSSESSDTSDGARQTSILSDIQDKTADTPVDDDDNW
jgi:hypothetical protein